MKIEGNNPIEGKDIYNRVQELNKNHEVDKKEHAQKTGSSSDKISLSERAKEINELKAVIEQLPVIRTEKVEEIKKAVEAGNYHIDSLKVAEKILQEI